VQQGDRGQAERYGEVERCIHVASHRKCAKKVKFYKNKRKITIRVDKLALITVAAEPKA
jgi:hypothetical protein